jgi:hypothetical protein
MSTEGETLQVSVLPYRCSIAPFAVSVLVVVQPSSEVPDGLMHYPVYTHQLPKVTFYYGRQYNSCMNGMSGFLSLMPTTKTNASYTYKYNIHTNEYKPHTKQPATLLMIQACSNLALLTQFQLVWLGITRNHYLLHQTQFHAAFILIRRNLRCSIH